MITGENYWKELLRKCRYVCNDFYIADFHSDLHDFIDMLYKH